MATYGDKPCQEGGGGGSREGLREGGRWEVGGGRLVGGDGV